LFQTGDQSQGCSFAASRWPKNGKQLSGMDRQIQFGEGMDTVVIDFAHVFQNDFHAWIVSVSTFLFLCYTFGGWIRHDDI
jgi:hypothetical protein